MRDHHDRPRRIVSVLERERQHAAGENGRVCRVGLAHAHQLPALELEQLHTPRIPVHDQHLAGVHASVEVEQLMQSDFREQRGTTVVSLAVLDTLEAGDTEKAKSLLARDIGVYYHAFKDREASLPQQCLIPLIDEVSSRSSALRAELQKEPK